MSQIDMRKLCLPILTVWYLSVLCVRNVNLERPECFHVESEACEEMAKNNTKCNMISDSQTCQIYCCNISSEREILDYVKAHVPIDKELSGFHMRDSNLSNLNVNNLVDHMKRLVSLSLTESKIDRFSGWFKENVALKCLNISQNWISEMPPHLILELKGLRNVVISNNTNITMLPLLPNIKNFQLDLSGNRHLSCKYLINLTEVIYRKNIELNQVKKNTTVCLPGEKVFSLIISMVQIEQVKEIFKNCPDVGGKDNCTCSVYSLDRTENSTLVYQALVDCSFRNMTSLPETLPPNTRVLNITHNKITSLEGIGNSTYGGIKELLADFNNITSLKQLEGSAFLHNFQSLSLTNNKIEEMSEYHILSNVFDRNSGRKVLLAKNVFKCNCDTASTTKTWLLSNTAHIPDYKEVETVCDGTRMKVFEMMNSNKLCSNPPELKDLLKYVIVAEITLFVLMIGKVSYDYYVFKTAGYLPWPASKMPKLPCFLISLATFRSLRMLSRNRCFIAETFNTIGPSSPGFASVRITAIENMPMNRRIQFLTIVFVGFIVFVIVFAYIFFKMTQRFPDSSTAIFMYFGITFVAFAVLMMSFQLMAQRLMGISQVMQQQTSDMQAQPTISIIDNLATQARVPQQVSSELHSKPTSSINKNLATQTGVPRESDLPSYEEAMMNRI